jgi:hypothetical protein
VRFARRHPEGVTRMKMRNAKIASTSDNVTVLTRWIAMLRYGSIF